MKDYVDYDNYVQEDIDKEKEKKETKKETKKGQIISVSVREFFKGVSGRGVDY